MVAVGSLSAASRKGCGRKASTLLVESALGAALSITALAAGQGPRKDRRDPLTACRWSATGAGWPELLLASPSPASQGKALRSAIDAD